jgi:DNA mismatch repair protein MutL
MPVIRQLPPGVINKIAAGEVIERPASVVKELLENSVDAGATRIDVVVEQGGSELIRVVDNGCGITAEQLPLAIASHATSKIASADDLFHVGTLGFRGEALASIAEVSHFLIRSRQAQSDAGAQIEVDGGVAGAVVPCGAPIGTTMEIRHLFFNTPVRRKFMRSTQAEMAHISEAVTRIALAWPSVHFTLRHNERQVFDLPPVASWRDRIAGLFGADLGAALIPLSSQDNSVRLEGYVADPTHSRANNRMQYLLLNGRFIRDRSLQHAFCEGYRGLLLHGRYPIGFLRFDMPPETVDVNVHPTKLEVRFQDSGRMYSQLLGTIRKKFLATDLTARIHAPQGATASVGAGVGSAASGQGEHRDVGADADAAARHRAELVAWAQGQLPGPEALQPQDPQGELELTYDAAAHTPLSLNRLDHDWTPRSGGHYRAEFASASPPFADAPTATRAPPVVSRSSSAAQAIQLHNRYLITETDEGMIVIDQHALHERILYEQLRNKINDGALETQRLLVPEPVTLTPAEAAVALDARDALAQIGIEVEPFGGDTVLVSTYPAMLANLNPSELLRQVVDQLMEGEKQLQRRDLLDSLLHMISCKAAVKAGDRLTPEEITALLDQRSLFQDSHHCPHGRPTSLVFTREELDRRFKRI